MKTYQRHILFWSLYFCICYGVDIVIYPQASLISELLFYFTHTLYLFYSNLAILQVASRQKKNKVSIGITLFIINVAIFYALRYTVRFIIIPAFNIPEDAPTDLKVHFAIGVTWVVNFVVYALAYFYFQSSIQKQKELRLKEQLQLKTEQEKLTLENERLRAQINPHFLFNTLNYFYNKTSTKMPEVSDGIAALADIMRSAIRKPDEDGLIPLDEEVINIDQLISIYQLRYNNNVYISFTKEGSVTGLRILPHILNTLVENGLKHGDLHKADQPLSIHLKITGKSIQFSVHNKIRRGPKENSHGIGMTYIRTHLDSIYKQGYELTVNEDNEFYTVTLNIDLSIAGQPHDALISNSASLAPVN